ACRDTAAVHLFHPDIRAKDSILHFAASPEGNLYVLTQKNLLIYESNRAPSKKTALPFFPDRHFLAYRLYFTPENRVLISFPNGIREFYPEQDSFSAIYEAPQNITCAYSMRD